MRIRSSSRKGRGDQKLRYRPFRKEHLRCNGVSVCGHHCPARGSWLVSSSCTRSEHSSQMITNFLFVCGGRVESETNTFNTTCLFLRVRRMFDQSKLTSMHSPTAHGATFFRSIKQVLLRSPDSKSPLFFAQKVHLPQI